MKEKQRDSIDGYAPATADVLLRVNMEISNKIKDMDAEDISELLLVFDKTKPTLEDLLVAESQRKKKNRLRKI